MVIRLTCSFVRRLALLASQQQQQQQLQGRAEENEVEDKGWAAGHGLGWAVPSPQVSGDSFGTPSSLVAAVVKDNSVHG